MPEDEENPQIEVSEDEWQEWFEAKRLYLRYRDLYEEHSARLKKLVIDGGATDVVVNGEIVATIRSTTSLRFDSKRFKDQYPDIHNQFLIAGKQSGVYVKRGVGGNGQPQSDGS